MSRRFAVIALAAALCVPIAGAQAQNRSYDLWDTPTGQDETILNGKLDMSGTSGGVGRTPLWEYGDDRNRFFFVGGDFDDFNDRRLGALRLRDGNARFRSRGFAFGGSGVGFSSSSSSFSSGRSFSRSVTIRRGGGRRW